MSSESGIMDFKKVVPTKRYNNEEIAKKAPEYAKLIETGHTPEDAVALLIPGIPPSKRRFVAEKFNKNPTLRALIAAEREKLIEQSSSQLVELNAEFVKKEYLDVYKESRENGDRGNALRALDALGRHFGMFIERSESRLIIDGQLNVSHETIDDDLRRLALTNGVKIEVIDDAEFEDISESEAAEAVHSEESELRGESPVVEGPERKGPTEGES